MKNYWLKKEANKDVIELTKDGDTIRSWGKITPLIKVMANGMNMSEQEVLRAMYDAGATEDNFKFDITLDQTGKVVWVCRKDHE